MPNLLSKLTATNPTATSLALLLLRLVAGGFMAIGHGWGKASGGDPSKFPDPLGIGNSASFYGAVFGELICAALIAIGLFTRLACLAPIFAMAVAAFIVHSADPFFMGGGKAKEPALIYLAMFATILLAGPGKYSLDALIFGRKSA